MHEGVRDAIALYDGAMLAMTLIRDLVRPAVDLNFGPQERYPLIKVGLGEQKNVELLLKSIPEFVSLGLPVEASQIYPLLGLTEPAEGKGVVLLRPALRPGPGAEPGGASPPPEEVRADPSGGGGSSSRTAKLSAEPVQATSDAVDRLADELGDEALIEDLRRQIEAAITESTSFDELKARLEGMAKGPAGQKLVEMLALSMFNARLAGELGAPVRDL